MLSNHNDGNYYYGYVDKVKYQDTNQWVGVIKITSLKCWGATR